MPPYDRVEKVLLVGSVSSDTGERPVIAYLFGVEAMSLFQTNETASGLVRLPPAQQSKSCIWHYCRTKPYFSMLGTGRGMGYAQAEHKTGWLHTSHAEAPHIWA